MKWITIKILLVLMFFLLTTSCDGGTPTPKVEPTQPQSEEPYPGPQQEKSAEERIPVQRIEPYPEPQNLTPAEPGVVNPPYDNEYAPKPDDDQLTRGNVFIEESGMLMLETYPVEVKLHLVGNLPTPCHELRAVVSPPDNENQIEVEVYSLSDPDLMCTQVLEPFTASIPLGGYAEGSFTVLVNGEYAGIIELP